MKENKTYYFYLFIAALLIFLNISPTIGVISIPASLVVGAVFFYIAAAKTMDTNKNKTTISIILFTIGLLGVSIPNFIPSFVSTDFAQTSELEVLINNLKEVITPLMIKTIYTSIPSIIGEVLMLFAIYSISILAIQEPGYDKLREYHKKNILFFAIGEAITLVATIVVSICSMIFFTSLVIEFNGTEITSMTLNVTSLVFIIIFALITAAGAICTLVFGIRFLIAEYRIYKALCLKGDTPNTDNTVYNDDINKLFEDREKKENAIDAEVTEPKDDNNDTSNDDEYIIR